MRWYKRRSACTRFERTAAPLPTFNVRDCMVAKSAARPISPPSASTSYTKCPFAVPPIEGLQGKFAIASSDIVKSTVSTPIRADASAASIPACPAPMTTTLVFISTTASSKTARVSRETFARNKFFVPIIVSQSPQKVNSAQCQFPSLSVTFHPYYKNFFDSPLHRDKIVV